MFKISIAGCTGRMGQRVLREAHLASDIDIVGALTRPQNPFVGQAIEALVTDIPGGPVITDDPRQAFQDADVVVDFSAPEAIETHRTTALDLLKPFLVCVTGLSDAQKESLEKAAAYIPVMIAPNTSVGIALLRKLAREAATFLGPAYDVSILEMHHRYKKDAPSGTSLSIGKELAKVEHLQHNLPPYPCCSPRPQGTIESVALRGGGVAGDHSVIFAGEEDLIEITHRALNPNLFAQGALKAAVWLCGQKPGLYTIDDMLEGSD